MPRKMPPLTVAFQQRVDEALALSEAGEIARAHGSPVRKQLTTRRIEALYEMAFLRAFVGWEVFLEETFSRYLCGYVSVHGALPRPVGMSYAPTLAAAETLVLGSKQYLLWHNPTHVIARCSSHFQPGSFYETVVSSSTARIQNMANVRHRIAHGSSDSAKKFDAATLSLVGKQYQSASAGKFLRDWVPGKTTPERWLSELARELVALASQIA
jgi:hypothetical protein